MKTPTLKNDAVVSSGRAIPTVIDVDYLGGYRLYLEFDDGTSGEVDLGHFIENTPPLRDLKDPKKFTQFALSDGTIRWGEGMDLSPRWLHEHTQ